MKQDEGVAPDPGSLGVRTSRASFDLPVMVDREQVRVRGSRADRVLFHQLARVSHAEIMRKRYRQGQNFLAEHAADCARPDFRIDRATGLGTLALAGVPALAEGLDEARRLIAARRPGEVSPSKGSIDYIASAEEGAARGLDCIDFASPITRLALDPNILAPVIDYLGALPILFSINVCESKNDATHEQSSQMWHLDPEDVTQMKVFIYLHDVDEETGPFTALAAPDTDEVLRAKPNYGVGRIADDDVIAILGEDRSRTFTGPKDTAVFCDTNRCLHYGSRPGQKPRHMLFLMYVLPTSTWFPLGPGDGAGTTMIGRAFDERATPRERAVLGMRLVPGGI